MQSFSRLTLHTVAMSTRGLGTADWHTDEIYVIFHFKVSLYYLTEGTRGKMEDLIAAEWKSETSKRMSSGEKTT